MNDKELKGLIEKGHILCRVIFEMAGNPKEHVEKTLADYIKSVKEDPDYIFTNEYQAPAEEHDDVWSTFYESEIIVSNLEKLNVLCFNLGPASVEIIRPESITLSDKKLSEHYNDLISKLHEIGISLKSISSENELLKVNLNRAIRNCVVISLNEPKTIHEISEKIGIDTEHLQTFLDVMIKDKSLVKDGEKYHKKI
jgi:lambda repressor-like predicted transcriptional regulator